MQTVLYPIIVKAILPRLTTCFFSKAENVGLFYDPLGILAGMYLAKAVPGCH